MAQFKSDTYTAQETAAGNAGKMIGSAELVSGKSAFLQCKVTVPAGVADGDTILLGYVPSGMTIVPGATVSVGAAAGASTFDIGFADNADGVAEAVSVNTTGTQLINVKDGGVKSTKRQALVATLDGALTAGRVFFVNLPLVNSN